MRNEFEVLKAEAFDALMAGGRELFADPELCAAACELLDAIEAARAYEAGGVLLREDGAVVTVDGRLVMAPEDVSAEMLLLD